jgi:hypothetical protein
LGLSRDSSTLAEVAVDQVTAVVDFGTSHTVVAVAGPGTPPRLVSVDGVPGFPSAVFWDRTGQGVVGRNALLLGRVEPARLERSPKARVGEDQVLLGDAVVATPVLVRTVLVRAVAEAVSAADAVVSHLVLTHPADWEPTKLGTLLTAAQGLVARVSTMAEPVAAAAWYAARHDLPDGAVLAVLDLGGGTCDAALVRREPTGLTVLACAVLPEPLPEALLTRVEFEDLVRPDLDRAVGLLDATARAAGLTSAGLAAVQLVGGPSGTPLLTRLLRAWTDAPIRLDDQPEAVVALGAFTALEGSFAASALRPRTTPGRDPDLTGPVPASEFDPPAQVPPRGMRATVAAVVVVAALVLGLAALIDTRGFGGSVAGFARAPSEAPRLTLPAAAAGEPVSVRGRSTAELPPARSGQFVDYVYQDSAVQWRLDSFDDTTRTHRGLTTLGNGLDSGYHWALVRYTVRTVEAVAGEPDLANQLYLVDDRGLMISTLDSYNGPANSRADSYLPEYCPSPATGPVAASTSLARCALFAVPDATPITEVAIAYHANSRPQPSRDEATLSRGARVAVNARDPRGADPVAPEDQHPLGGAVHMRTDEFSAEVAVAGLVEDASGYLDEDSTIILGGSRAVILRLAVRVAEPMPASNLVSVSTSLLDDRGAPVDPAVVVGTNECLNTGSEDEVSGTVALCVLFAVPTGASPRAALVQAAPGAEPEVWRLR